MNESVFSKKVTWFSFAFSILVIWVHSYNAELFLGGTRWAEPVGRFEYWIIDWIAQIAVPGFFMISAYLFYRNFDMSRLPYKWKRRIVSVLVPYITWNFLYYVGYAAASRMPWMGEIVGKGVIPFGLDAAVDAIINHTYNYVFWYLHQLIWLILLAPLLYPILVRRWSRILFLCVVSAILFFDLRLPLVNPDALFYYSLSASAALTIRDRIEQEEAGEMTGRVGIILVFAGVIAYILGLEHKNVLGFVLCRVCAVAGSWLFVSGNRLPDVMPFMRYNFFLYAVHFGIVRFINKVFAEYLSGIPAVPVILFIGMPVLVLAVSTGTARFLEQKMPRIWKLFNGGR